MNGYKCDAPLTDIISPSTSGEARRSVVKLGENECNVKVKNKEPGGCRRGGGRLKMCAERGMNAGIKIRAVLMRQNRESKWEVVAYGDHCTLTDTIMREFA